MRWSILYRGPLSSCNYSCDYCPFAKTKNTRAELADDAAKLRRFVDWVASREEQIGILITPWGEALIRRYYQEAMTELSHLPNVWKIAIQTNLSCSTKWMEKVNRETFALWTTYHPTQITISDFIKKTKELDQLNIRYSVGFVGFKEELGLLERLREELAASTYLWVNAYKRDPNYYTAEDILRIEAVDPLFRYNTQYHPSLGKPCQAGNTSFSVDGDGNMQSCHFIKQSLGNIYEPGFEAALKPRNCINDTCGCHIGYVHLDELGLYEKFGDGLLERAL
jgi:MoaA/NifB/PqqE/SkfB family radical SAM enzyme